MKFKTIAIALLLVLATMSAAFADETNVFMYVNWADGSSDFIDVEQGRSITVNYESYTPFPFDVETNVYLVQDYDFENPIQTLISRTDLNGHYGFVTLETENLDFGEYTIYGTAVELFDNTNNEAQVDFRVVANTGTNQPPVFNSIPTEFEYLLSEVDDELLVVNNFVSDPDGDILTINIDASQTDSSVAICNLFFDSALHCDFMGAGETTVDVVVTDGEFTITETLTIRVLNDGGDNTAPYFTDLQTYFEIGVSESAQELVNLENVALDDEADTLTFSLNTDSTDSSIVDCTLVGGSSLTCAPLSIGGTTVDVVVSDGELESSETIIINVYDDSNGNQAPYFSGLQNFFQYPIGQGEADLANLATFAIDPDGDALTFSVDQDSTSIATCSIANGATLHCDFNSLGTTEFEVVVTDGSLSARQTITLQITENSDENNPPAFTGLPLVYTYPLSEQSATLVRLSDYASDIDGDALSYDVEQNSGAATCTLDADSDLNCIFNSEGSSTFDVIVTDGEFSDTKTILVIVNQDNNAPYFENLQTLFNYDLSEGQVTVLDIANFARDADADVLSYDIDTTNTDSSVVDCSVTNSVVDCDLEGVGTTAFDIIADDGIDTARATITVIVSEEGNSAPQFDVNMPTSFSYDIALQSASLLRVSDYVTDADGDVLSFNIDQTNTDISIVDCNMASDSTINCDLNGVGVTTLVVEASDGEATATRTLTVTVTEEENTAPYFNGLPGFFQYNLSEQTVNVVRLSNFAVDDEDDQLSFSVTQANNDVVDCRLDTNTDLICDLESVGTDSVDVTVTDGLLSTTQAITINVVDDGSNNNAPFFNNLTTFYEFEIGVGSAMLQDLATVSVDPDGDALTYTINQANTDISVVDCSIQSGSELTCNFVGLGTTEVDVVVSDGVASTSRTVTIRVVDGDINNPPTFVGLPTIYNINLTPSQNTIADLANFAVDPENDFLTFGIDTASIDTSVVDCSLVADSIVVCDVFGFGTTQFNVSVSDGEFTTTQTLVINVVNDGGNAIAIIDSPGVVVINQPVVFDGSSSIGANNNAIVDYSWIITEGALVITQTGATPQITHTFTNFGTHSVVLTVTDTDGNNATTSLSVTVEDEYPVAIISVDSVLDEDEDIVLDGSLSYAKLDATLVSYEWVILDEDGDEIATRFGVSPTYEFDDTGDYIIELTVIDSNGLTGFASLEVEVVEDRDSKFVNFDAERGLKVESFGVYGHDFERAQPGDLLEVVVDLRNQAGEDLDGLRLTLIIPELGIKEKSKALDLEDGERGTLVLFSEVPEYAEEGVYYPQISISDGDIRRVKIAYLEVEE